MSYREDDKFVVWYTDKKVNATKSIHNYGLRVITDLESKMHNLPTLFNTPTMSLIGKTDQNK